MIVRVARRTVLGVLLHLSAGILWRPSRALAKPVVSCSTHELAAKLASVFSCRESAVVVGGACLQHLQTRESIDRLVDRVCTTDQRRRAQFACADVDQLRQLLAEQQRRDFEDGRVMSIQGWILSESEVRLLAITAWHHCDADI